MHFLNWTGRIAALTCGALLVAACGASSAAATSEVVKSVPLGSAFAARTTSVLESAFFALQRPFSATGGAEMQLAQAQELSEDELLSQGEEVYAQNCATCHQPNGQGAGAYPALAGNSFVTSEDPTQVIETIVEGRAGMPAFGDTLDTAQIAAVASHIRNAWDNGASVVTVAEVSEIQGGGAAGGEAESQQAGSEQDAAGQEGAEQESTEQTGTEQGSQQGEGEAAEAQPTPAPQATSAPAGPTPIVIEIQIVPVIPSASTPQPAQDATTPTSAPTTPTASPTPTPASADAEGSESQGDAESVESGDAADENEAAEGDASAQAEDEASAQASEQQQDSATSGGQQLGSAVEPGGDLPGEPAIELVKIAEGLIDPINVAAPADGSGRLFIIERVGRIRIVENGELLEEPFLDISENMKTDFLEQGLLGLAFHPDYANNGRFFVYYTDWRTNGDSVVAEFHVSEDDPNLADPESARVLLTHDQPFVNHNGGTILFGPDGYLYITLGDGGMAGDPYRNAQNLSTLLGKILRIDVDTESSQGYAIPEDNPFRRQVLYSSDANDEAQDGDYIPGARPEIYLYGLRNAWQFSFDRDTGDLYIADVGQNAWEEINFLPAGSEGGINYGWPQLEGSHCYLNEECGVLGELPVAEYSNPDQGCSITGIGVYRGEQSASLDGIYFASDYCTGRVWGLMRDENDEWQFEELLDTDFLVAGAGTDEAGELYITDCGCQFGRDYDPYENPNGTVWQIVAADQVPEGAETASSQEQQPEEQQPEEEPSEEQPTEEQPSEDQESEE